MSDQPHTSTVFLPAATVQDCAQIAAAEFRYWNEHNTPEAIGATGAAANILCAINGPRAEWHPQTNAPGEAAQAVQSATWERDSLRCDSDQLGRFVEAVTKAMPNFRCAFGSAADHAEAALAFLIADRDRLYKAAGEVHTAIPYGPQLDPEANRALASLHAALVAANTPADPTWQDPQKASQ